MNETISYIVLFAVIIIAFVVAPQLRLRRTIPRIIRSFRQTGAIDSDNAKTLDELGLRSLFTGTSSILSGGDPYQTALQTLKDAKIVQNTREGRWFLSESQLAASKWRDRSRTTADKKQQ